MYHNEVQPGLTYDSFPLPHILLQFHYSADETTYFIMVHYGMGGFMIMEGGR